MWMFGRRLQFHQINNINDTDFNHWRNGAQQVNRCEGFKGGNIATTCHDHIGFGATIITGPIPDTNAHAAMFDRRIHVEPLRRWLFTRNNNIDVIFAA